MSSSVTTRRKAKQSGSVTKLVPLTYTKESPNSTASSTAECSSPSVQQQPIAPSATKKIAPSLPPPHTKRAATSNSSSAIEKKREKERAKKARYRARLKEREYQSHHLEVPYSKLPKSIWKGVKQHLKIKSTETPEDEANALIFLLNTIGYEWDGTTGVITRAPSREKFEQIRNIRNAASSSSSNNNNK